LDKIADVLTFIRFPAFVAVLILGLEEYWTAAAIVFAVAILSDAVDGIVARRWKPKERWYRKDPHQFDNAGDSALFFSGLVVLVARGPTVWDWVMVVSVVGTVIIVFFINKLRPSRAERLDVAFGWCFGVLLFAMQVQMTALATAAWPWWLLAYIVAAIVIVVTKWDRMTSRSEVTYNGTW